MTALKVLRRDLTDHLAFGLNASASPLGAQVNPPAVIVQAGSPYVTASTYCDDEILFEATIVAPPGDLPAVADALDDMTDKVRSTLRKPSPGGHRYGFREVTGPTSLVLGDQTFPAVLVIVAIERVAP